MLKIIDKYLIKEISSSTLGVIAVLLVIMLGNTTLVVLRSVAEGSLRSSVLFPLLGVNLVHYLVVLIPLGLYLGILFAMGRLYKDSEMVSLSAGGVSVLQLYRGVLWVAMPTVFIAIFLAFIAVPWTSNIRDDLRFSSDSQSELSGVVPGRFNKLNGEQSTLFLENFSPDHSRMLNVFVHNTQPDGGTTIETANSAEQRVAEGKNPYMIFHHGAIYSGESEASHYRITEYVVHGMQLEQKVMANTNKRIGAVPTTDLWQREDVAALAELHWRIGVPLLTLLLAALALPLSYSSPRKGRYSKLGIGILLYIVYSNLLSVARASLEKGSVPEWFGFWWAHLLMVALIAFLLCQQIGVRIWPRFSGSKATGNAT